MIESVTSRASGIRTARLNGRRKQLRAILCEALHCAALRAEIDGMRSGRLGRLIESLRVHIRNVDRGSSSPTPGHYRRWLRRLCRVPSDAPHRWRDAAKLLDATCPGAGTEGTR